MLHAILSIAIPVVINSFLQTMYNLTDTYWLGKIGTEQLTAINLVTPDQSIIMNFGSGITVAGSVLIAQYIGAHDEENAKSMANQIFACVCAGLCFIFTPTIVQWLGADGNTLRYGNTYLRIVVLDMLLLYTINIFSAINQAQGNTVKPMPLNLLGIIINMILDPLLMIVFDLNIAGAALATLFAKVPSALIAFYSLNQTDNPVHLNLRKLRFEKGKMQSILRVGLPTAIGGRTMQFGFLLMSKNVYVYGTQAMAADFLSIMAFCCWTNGINNSTIGLFQGTGHTEINMLVDATRLWVFRFLTLFICEEILHMGVQSIWYCVVASNAISATILFLLYKLNIWRKPVLKKEKHV